MIFDSDLRPNSKDKLLAVKTIGREFPDLPSEQLFSIHRLSKLAQSFLVDENRINGIPNFSLSIGIDTEATITASGVPFIDYDTVQTELFQSDLDKKVEAFAWDEGLKLPGFRATSYENLSGWTSALTIGIVQNVQNKLVADGIFPAGTISFNAAENYINGHSSNFDLATHQAIKIYRFVILTKLYDVLSSSFRQILEEVYLAIGNERYSTISVILGKQLNFDNRRSLELSAEAERNALDVAVGASRSFGAIFPQITKRGQL